MAAALEKRNEKKNSPKNDYKYSEPRQFSTFKSNAKHYYLEISMKIAYSVEQSVIQRTTSDILIFWECIIHRSDHHLIALWLRSNGLVDFWLISLLLRAVIVCHFIRKELDVRLNWTEMVRESRSRREWDKKRDRIEWWKNGKEYCSLQIPI